MLGEEEIGRLAKLRRVKPWQEERRYLQALVLYSLSEEPIVFKGGTYLWFFHGLNRFSEDLDFTATEEVGRSVLESASNTLRLFGVGNEAKMIKDDRYVLSFRISARGPLFTSEKDLCHVYVEVSRRDRPVLAPLPVKLDEAYYGIPLVFLRGMDLRELVSEKVRAMMTRNAARDLYDLWYVAVRLGVKPDLANINEKLSFYGKSFDLREFRDRVGAVQRFWEGELRPLVFGALPEFGEAVRELEEALGSITQS
jgi:hypothetical protein